MNSLKYPQLVDLLPHVPISGYPDSGPGVTAMATSQGRSPCLPVFQESSKMPRKLRRRSIILKRQKVRNPVVEEINFCKIKRADIWNTDLFLEKLYTRK